MAITINGSGITSANIADGTITASDISASEVKNLKSGRKNLIINGGFDVWQRGTSFPWLSSANNYGYTADRWYVNGNLDTFTVSDVLDDGVKFDIHSSNGSTRLIQYIEDWKHLSGKTVTISFDVKTNNSASLATQYENGKWQYTLKTTFTTSTAWQRVEITDTLPNLTGLLAVGIWSDVATTIYLRNVQLELGSVATDFEHRSYGEELALCQRYYQDSGTQAYSAYLQQYHQSYKIAEVTFTGQMRASPDMTAAFAGTSSDPAIYGVGNRNVFWYFADPVTSTSSPKVTTWTADAEL